VRGAVTAARRVLPDPLRRALPEHADRFPPGGSRRMWVYARLARRCLLDHADAAVTRSSVCDLPGRGQNGRRRGDVCRDPLVVIGIRRPVVSEPYRLGRRT